VGLARRTFVLETRRANRRLTSRRSPLTTFAVALSLIFQLFAAAAPPALATPAFAGADDVAIAAELKALFGDTAQLCVQVNDDKAPAQHNPSGPCCDQCPLCRFAAQAVTFVAPEGPAMPQRVNDGRHTIGAAPDFEVFSACPTRTNFARAPPLAV
jgi:hypothetical protein